MRLTQFIDRQVEIEDAFDGGESEAKARGYFFVLVVIYATECLSIAIRQRGSWIPSTWIEVTLVPLLLAFCALSGRRQITAAALFGVVLFRVVTTFPEGANHAYMLTLLFGLFACFDLQDPTERAWLLATAKWTLIVILFYSGLQKLLYGYYSHGEYFAYSIARYEHFRQFFSLLLPSQEIARLSTLRLENGAGPFRLHSNFGVLLSRGAYTAELILPFLLLHHRTRMLGVVGSILMIAVIEAAAREFSFGLQFVNLTLLFTVGRVNDRLKWGFALAGLVMIAIRVLGSLQLIPEVYFL